MTIYLDTHAIVWLYGGQSKKFSEETLSRLETEDLKFSPMAFLEIEYLSEIGRIKMNAEKITDYLAAHLDLKLCSLPFGRVSAFAVHEKWTRDPFDRMIVAQARLGENYLLTKDEIIRAHYPRCID